MDDFKKQAEDICSIAHAASKSLRAQFGVVYFFEDEQFQRSRCRAISGRTASYATVKQYFRSTGDRVKELKRKGHNLVCPLMSPTDAELSLSSWYCVMITKLPASRFAVALAFDGFTGEDECVRCLREVEAYFDPRRGDE